MVRERRWNNALGDERGVAGIRKFEYVKCLHAHAAHYLAYCGFVQRQKHQQNEEIQDGMNKQNKITNENDFDSTYFVENLVGKWVLEAVEELIMKGGIVASDQMSIVD